jgi:multiple antibiotic resistance protein
MDWVSLLSLFFLGFSSLFPLINPVGTALIINPYFSNSRLPERKVLATSVMLYCLVLGLVMLFLGSWCLRFMGISIPTTQMAGGLIIARMGLGLLNSDDTESDKTALTANVRKSLFYPIAFPLTLGPGCVSVLITLSAHANTEDLAETLVHMGVLSLSLIAVLILTYICFIYSSAVIRKIGPSGSLVLNRLMAFLVFCVGIQMLVTGLAHSFPHLLGN